MQDIHLPEKLAHFDRERIPERVVHAKGAGAHGYFEVTHDVTKYTRAKFLSEVGKRTEVFARFSTVGAKRAPRTRSATRAVCVEVLHRRRQLRHGREQHSVFFIRDPLKFPDFIHTQKRTRRPILRIRTCSGTSCP